MGGADAVIERAKRGYASGDYRWVAIVLNHLVYADPSNTDAKNLLAEGKTKIDAAIKSGQVRLTGSQTKFDQSLSVFDSFDAWYNVVTPLEAN